MFSPSAVQRTRRSSIQISPVESQIARSCIPRCVPSSVRFGNKKRAFFICIRAFIRRVLDERFQRTMAQNINPFYSSQSTPNKSKEEKQNVPKDNHAVSKRLQKELMVLMTSTEKGVSAFPDGENLFKWIGTISGPLDTVYAGLTYKLTLEFPHSYPYSAPVVRFVTRCFHPNVDPVGNICLDILKDKWSALYDVRTILLSIQSLLGEPNNESPLNLQAAELWNDRTKYKKQLYEEYHRDSSRGQDS